MSSGSIFVAVAAPDREVNPRSQRPLMSPFTTKKRSFWRPLRRPPPGRPLTLVEGEFRPPSTTYDGVAAVMGAWGWWVGAKGSLSGMPWLLSDQRRRVCGYQRTVFAACGGGGEDPLPPPLYAWPRSPSSSGRRLHETWNVRFWFGLWTGSGGDCAAAAVAVSHSDGIPERCSSPRLRPRLN